MRVNEEVEAQQGNKAHQPASKAQVNRAKAPQQARIINSSMGDALLSALNKK